MDKSLINLGNNKVVEKAYDDILSNPGRKVSEALGTIINIGNTLLWPIKWANERTRIYFENNLKKYEERLSKIDDSKIIEVPTEISMPILERFTYVSNDEISNAFINLLTSASSTETIQFAHPSFIQVIDRLSPDEAKIIKYFSVKDAIPYITLSKHDVKAQSAEDLLKPNYKPQIDTSSYITLCQKANDISDEVELNFSNNLSIYLDNLISLGLIRDLSEYFYLIFKEDYQRLTAKLLDEYKDHFSSIPENLRIDSQKVKQGMFELTDFGKLFVKSSIT
ncbi:DUF4393 domain-containing protein [Pedobacter sp. UBA5917]|jgi:hypothetical protein|uniref:DUF4393 domain-containing protein n=1 Tax=Pedobacter sp. UBA5917 TaxID=1947061 RepID=UPI0025CC33B6|nr:DUF4393 domain-containing protein [Pedobacter sp. UBA5917]